MSLSKMIMGQSGNQGSGASLDVDDVYSTFVYQGTNANNNSIVNNIDLSGEGGLVWIKSRENSRSHQLFDTERGVQKILASNLQNAQSTNSTSLTAFNSNGWTMNDLAEINGNEDLTSWTFRKAPKFFDIVTYTGDGTQGRTISHSLELTPGMIFIKKTSADEDWSVWHRNLHTNSSGETTQFLKLNSTNGAFPLSPTSSSSATSDVQAASSTTFTIGNDSRVNGSSATYVAYIFAHNNSDGGFGPSANQDIIKCGTYDGNGSTSSGPHINLGFEPQWILVKCISEDSVNWTISDTIRGFHQANKINLLLPHSSNSESEISTTPSQAAPTPTGFQIQASGSNFNKSGQTYIFMAIRRGPLAAPTSSSQVFEVDNAGSTGDGVDPKFRSGFPVDFALRKDTGSGNWEALTRLLQGTSLRPNDTDAEDSGSGGDQFDYMNGYNTGTNTDSSLYSWMWKRAPKYFDVVTYTGASGAQTITHNLGVVPEMIWLKKRSEVSATNGGWVVYHGTTSNLILNENFSSGFAVNNSVNHSTISATTFEVANGNTDVNDNGETHVAYLFATVAGVSKIGSVAHSGSSTDVDCGFSNGSKFVLLKRTDDTSNWRLFDSDRGIVSGNDPHTFVNLSTSQNTSTDLIDPLSSGFQITGDLDDGTYLFYAIAA